MTDSNERQPTTRALRLGKALRELRGEHKSSDVEAATGVTPSKLSRIEAAQVRARPEDIETLLDYYGADARTKKKLVTAANRLREPSEWHKYVGPTWPAALINHLELEADAAQIDSWTIDLVPGLLQSPSYTEALIDSRPDVDQESKERRLELRKQRQRRVNDGQLRLWAIVGETVLHQLVGGPATLAEQLEYLAATPSTVKVQVLPFTAGAHAAAGNSFHIFQFAEWPSMVYQDSITAGNYQDNPETVKAYEDIMEHSRAAALSLNDSRDLLTRRAAQLREGQ